MIDYIQRAPNFGLGKDRKVLSKVLEKFKIEPRPEKVKVLGRFKVCQALWVDYR